MFMIDAPLYPSNLIKFLKDPVGFEYRVNKE